jgi:hypothetical protein
VEKQDNTDVKLALEEMRFTMEQILSAGDALDQKVNGFLVAAGIVLAISTTLQISLSPNHSDLYWAILLVTIGLYIIAVGVVLISAKPYAYRMAIAAKWDELDKHIFGKQERDAYLDLLSGYVDQIQHNQKINVRKAKLQMCSIVILALTIVLLIILVCVP